MAEWLIASVLKTEEVRSLREFESRTLLWGISSVGRAPALQAGCQRFESAILHSAHVAELVDALGLGSSRFICGGSSPLMSISKYS